MPGGLTPPPFPPSRSVARQIIPDAGLGQTGNAAKIPTGTMQQRLSAIHRPVAAMNEHMDTLRKSMELLLDSEKGKNTEETGNIISIADDLRVQRAMDGADRGSALSRTMPAGTSGSLGLLAKTKGKTELPKRAKAGANENLEVPGMKWVKNLIKFTETFPIHVPPSGDERELDIGVPADPTGQQTGPLGPETYKFTTTVFPSPRPMRKEDTYLLEHWMREMLKQIPEPAEIDLETDSVIDVADAVLWVYQKAFDELERHISFISQDRATLMRRIWVDYFKLVQVKERLAYEYESREMASAATEIHQHAEAVELDALQCAKDAQLTIDAADLEKKASERDAKRLAQRLSHANGERKMAQNALDKIKKQLLEEIASRLRREDELQETKEVLELERNLHNETRDRRDNYRSELDEHIEMLGATRMELARSQNITRELELANAKLKVDYTDIKIQIQDIKRDKDAGSLVVNETMRELEQLRKRLKVTTGELTTITAEHGVLKERSEKSGEENQELTASLKLAQAGRDKMTQAHASVSKELVLTKRKREQIEATLERERTEKKESVRDFNKIIAGLKQDIDDRDGTIADLEAQLKKAKAKISEHEGHHAVSFSIFRGFKDIFKGNYDDASAADDFRDLGRIETLSKFAKVAVDKTRKCREDLRQTERRLVVAETRFKAEEDLRKKGERKVYEEKARNERVIRDLNTASTEAARFKQSHSDATLKIAKLERDLEISRGKQEKLSDEVKTLGTKCAKLDEVQKENAKLTDNLNNTSTALDRAMHDKNLTEQQLTELEADHRRNVAEIKQLTAMQNNLLGQVDFLGSQIEKKDTEMTALNAKIESSEETYRRNFEEKGEQLRVLTEERDQLVEDLAIANGTIAMLRKKLKETQNTLKITRFMLKGMKQAAAEAKEIAEATGQVVAPAPAPAAPAEPEEEEEEEEEVIVPDYTGETAVEEEGPSRYDEEPQFMMRIKIGLLSYFCRKLRIEVQKEFRLRLEFEKQWFEDTKTWENKLAAMLKERIDFERSELKQLKSDVLDLRDDMAETSDMVNEMGRWGVSCGTRLNGWETRHKTRKDFGLMVSDAAIEPWLRYINELPPGVPPNASTSLEKRKIIKVICQCYTKRIDLMTTDNFVGGDQKQDTIFDTLLSTFRQVYGHFDTSPAERNMAEFLCSLRAHQDDLKILTFSKFCGIAPEFHAVEFYHFFLSVLDCTRRLLGVNWRTVMQEWEVGSAGLPVPCMMDILANAYNTNQPAQLPVVQGSLKHIMKEGKLGPSVDLDSFLATLLKEFGNRQCPLVPMLAPRRISSEAVSMSSFAL